MKKGSGLVIGIAIGTAVGAATGNLGLWLGLGVVLGILIENGELDELMNKLGFDTTEED